MENIFMLSVGALAMGVVAWHSGKGLWLMYKDYKYSQQKKEQRTREKDSAMHPAIQAALNTDVHHNTNPQMRLGVIEAINGRILEVSIAVPHPMHHGHCDWKTEMYVVPQEQKLSEAIAVLMLMKGLEK